MVTKGLCGWLGYRTDAGDAERILLEMMASQDGTGRPDVVMVTEGLAGLAVPSTNEAAVFDDGEVLSAICGHPVYADTQLHRLAQQQGPAAAFAAGYRKMGNDVLQLMHGSFCVALVNHKEESAFLAVDRLAIRSMTATVAGRCLVFASSARAVKKHPLVYAPVDPQAVFNYVYFHVVPAPGCVYKNFMRLLPGSYLRFSHGRLRAGTYWKMDYRQPSASSFEGLRHEFVHLLEQGVRRQVDGRRAGAFLSGGTDSSTIVGMLGRVTGEPPRTYSIGFDAKGYDEMQYARITARHFGTEHHEYYVTPEDVLAIIPVVAHAYGSPYGNASAVPTYYCARCAKQDGVEVMFAGDGGDELFGGNARYARQWLLSLYDYVPRTLRKSVVEPVLFALPAGNKLSGADKLRSYVRQAAVPMPERLETYNLLQHFGPKNVFSPAFLDETNSDEPIVLLRHTYAEICADNIVERMLGLDLRMALADNDLPKVTQMCHLAGVDVRFPLLDDDIVAFSARLPAHLKLKRTRLRFFFKEALRDFLPAATLSKTKHGFGLPCGVWLHTHSKLHELARDSLDGLVKRGILLRRFVDELLGARLSEHPHYYGTFAWVLMMLEQWFRAHADWRQGAQRADSSATSAQKSVSGFGPTV